MRYVGEPVAVVLADSAAIAEDALALIDLDIEALPAVADRRVAGENQSLLFEEQGTNVVAHLPGGARRRRGGVSRRALRRRERFHVQRHFGLTMEPRGVLAEWDAARGMLTVSGAAKVPFFNRRILAKQIGLPEESIDMIENDVGGGFGARGEFYPEDFLIPFAARHIGRPVKWTEDRREHLMAMNHAREADCDIEIACARDGTILGPARARVRRHGRLHAHQRRGRRAQHRAVHVGALSHSRHRHRRRDGDDQQDAGRHLSRAGPVRDRFLPRAADRHGGGATSASTGSNSAGATSSPCTRCPIGSPR